MLTAKQVAQYHTDGFVLGPRVLDAGALRTLRAELARIEHTPDGDNTPALRTNLGRRDAPIWQTVNIWMASAAFRALLSHPAIVRAAAQLSRATELRVWHDQVQDKPARHGGVNMWHQDSPLWAPLEPKDEQVTAWVALDDADEENGCMRMVAGSHRWGDNLAHLSAVREFDELPSEFEGHEVNVRACCVPEGHVHFHHPLTWHGSPANPTARPRRAVAVHYMTGETIHTRANNAGVAAFARLLKITSTPGGSVEGPYFATVLRGDEILPVASVSGSDG